MDPVSSELLAGGFGGAVGVFVGQPFDFVKVRLQSLGKAYTGPIDCLRKTIQQEGLLGLYRGMAPPVINSFCLNAVIFGTYGHARGLIDHTTSCDRTKSFIAGSYAGLMQVGVLVPFDLVKCQMQVDRVGGRAGQFNDGFDCARKIAAKEGVAGLYRGGLVTIVRDSPTTGAYFAIFETLELSLPRWSAALGGENATFIAGGMSGVITWALAYPADTVKTHLQTLPLSASAHERSIVHTVRTIYAQHGARYFYRGLGTCLARAFPVNAITFVVYKRLKQLLSPPSTDKR